MQKNVSGQKWRVFAFDRTDNTAKTGDAAQITAKISIDNGTATALTDTNPTETEDGYYLFDLTQAETNGNHLSLYPESSTANISVMGSPPDVSTMPPNFAELGIESDGDLTQVNDVANQVSADVTAISGDSSAADNIEADYDGTGYNKSASAIGSVGSVTAAVTTDSASREASKATGFSTHSAADVWAVATRTLSSFGSLVSTIWANATRTLTAGTKDSEIDAILADTDELQGNQGDWATAEGFATEVKQDIIDANVDAVLVDTGTTLPGLIAVIDSVVDAILVDTGTDLPAQISGLNDISAAEVNTEVADVIKTDTLGEPAQGAPPATASLEAKIAYLYKWARNKKDQNATVTNYYNDAGDTVDHKQPVSDDGTTATKGEIVSGP